MLIMFLWKSCFHKLYIIMFDCLMCCICVRNAINLYIVLYCNCIVLYYNFWNQVVKTFHTSWHIYIYKQTLWRYKYDLVIVRRTLVYRGTMSRVNDCSWPHCRWCLCCRCLNDCVVIVFVAGGSVVVVVIIIYHLYYYYYYYYYTIVIFISITVVLMVVVLMVVFIRL